MRIDWESWDSLFEFAMFPTHLDRESGRLLNAEDSAMGAGDPSARERELLDEWADES